MPLGKSLGNILGDYFGEEVVDLQTKKEIKQISTSFTSNISINSIELSPYQTRTQFDFEKIQGLAENIKEHGLIHPVVVIDRKNRLEGQKEYILLAGERRLRACKLLGYKEILAIIRPQDSLDDRQQAMLSAMENLQREDLTPIELGNTFKMLIQTQNIDEQVLAEMLSTSVQYIKNYLRLLLLSKPVQEALLNKTIGEGQARYLVGLSEEKQFDLLKLIIDKDMTVKEISSYLKNSEPIKKIHSKIHNLPSDIVLKASKLAEQFSNVKLKCQGDTKKGRIVISWDS